VVNFNEQDWSLSNERRHALRATSAASCRRSCTPIAVAPALLFSLVQPCAVGADGEVIGAMLATHAAGVMMVNRRQEVESALASRDFIGQAKDILMNQFSVDSVRAFELMVQSQNTNTRSRSSLSRSSTYTPADSADGLGGNTFRPGLWWEPFYLASVLGLVTFRSGVRRSRG
jgi:hypothetical protein